MDKFVKRRIAFVLATLLVLGLGGFLFKSEIRSGYEAMIGNDYAGPGTGSVTIEVASGDSGSDIVTKLVELGVVKDYRFAMRMADEKGTIFYPGSFELQLQMRAIDALAVLGSAQNAAAHHVTIKEGLRISRVFATLSDVTKIPVADFRAAASDLSKFKLGAGAPSLEGYLFPATYDFGTELDALSILQIMNQRMVDELESFGLAKADWHRTLTLAGLIQAEARRTEDFYKVSRTFLNRIDVGMKLQSDATVSYGVSGNTVSTSAADRADDNAYNTYLHAGLPVGPISAPGRTAIDAALHPADGKWLYFCAVNLETGETWFSNTYAEHGKAVAAWRAWMLENPGYE